MQRKSLIVKYFSFDGSAAGHVHVVVVVVVIIVVVTERVFFTIQEPRLRLYKAPFPKETPRSL